ncbi:MAG: formate dehydrogenase accessory sulfurtransferase FdhD [Candidatus Bathyarchaeia archaeon]
MSIDFCVEKINTYSNTRKMVDEAVAIEAPVNIFINDEYVITLLSTPKFKKELAIGWLYDEGVLESMNQLKQISTNQDELE